MVKDNREILDVLIIGAGPAGISMGVEAIVSGVPSHRIVILEKEAAHSWSIRKFYPEEKLVTANYKGEGNLCHGVACISDMSKKETLSFLDMFISNYNLNVQYNHVVQSIKKDNDLFTIQTQSETYYSKTCVIAIGIFGRPNKPDYKIPTEIKDKIYFDITSRTFEGSDILVVGGGDSASEYCQYLLEKNNKMTLSYRKNDFSRMNLVNSTSLTALHEMGKVDLLLNTNVKDLKLSGNKVSVEFDEKGLVREFDFIIYALGGSTPENFLKFVGIEFDGKNPILKDNFETNIPGLFLIGDLSSGKKGGSIISAFNSAHKAMYAGVRDRIL